MTEANSKKKKKAKAEAKAKALEKTRESVEKALPSILPADLITKEQIRKALKLYFGDTSMTKKYVLMVHGLVNDYAKGVLQNVAYNSAYVFHERNAMATMWKQRPRVRIDETTLVHVLPDLTERQQEYTKEIESVILRSAEELGVFRSIQIFQGIFEDRPMPKAKVSEPDE